MSGWVDVPLSINLTDETVRFVIEARSNLFYTATARGSGGFDTNFISGMTVVGKFDFDGPAFQLSGHTGVPDPPPPPPPPPEEDRVGGEPVVRTPLADVFTTEVRTYLSVGLIASGVVLILVGRRL